MTLDDWLISADPYAMCDRLFPVHGTGSAQTQPRELRLYLCALARAHWKHLPGAIRCTIEVAEAHADAPLELWDDVKPISQLADEMQRFDGHPDDLTEWTASLAELKYTPNDPSPFPKHPPELWQEFAILAALPMWHHVPPIKWIRPARHRCDLIRDIFFPPQLTLAQEWQQDWHSQRVVDLAESIYRSRQFDLMPILADALEERGCNFPLALEHCRNPRQPHARGCWVLDKCLEPREKERQKWAEHALRNRQFDPIPIRP